MQEHVNFSGKKKYSDRHKQHTKQCSGNKSWCWKKHHLWCHRLKITLLTRYLEHHLWWLETMLSLLFQLSQCCRDLNNRVDLHVLHCRMIPPCLINSSLSATDRTEVWTRMTISGTRTTCRGMQEVIGCLQVMCAKLISQETYQFDDSIKIENLVCVEGWEHRSEQTAHISILWS